MEALFWWNVETESGWTGLKWVKERMQKCRKYKSRRDIPKEHLPLYPSSHNKKKKLHVRK